MPKFDKLKKFYSLAAAASVFVLILFPKVRTRNLANGKEKRGTFFLRVDSYESPFFWTIDNKYNCEGWMYLEDCEIYLKINISFANRSRSIVSSTVDTAARSIARFGKFLREDVENPVAFPLYNTESSRLTFEVGVWDDDDMYDDELEHYRHTLQKPLLPSKEWENVNYFRSRKYQSYESWSMLILAYRLACEVHYFGDLCSRKCIPEDGDKGHYTCNISGHEICRPGWTKPPACKTKLIKRDEHKYSGVIKLWLISFITMLPVFTVDLNTVEYCGDSDPCKLNIYIELTIGKYKVERRTDTYLMRTNKTLRFGSFLKKVGWVSNPFEIRVPRNITETKVEYFIVVEVQKNDGRITADYFDGYFRPLLPLSRYVLDRHNDEAQKLGSRLLLIYVLKCADNFYNVLCSVWCFPPEDKHYKCGKHGEKIFSQEYTYQKLIEFFDIPKGR